MTADEIKVGRLYRTRFGAVKVEFEAYHFGAKTVVWFVSDLCRLTGRLLTSAAEFDEDITPADMEVTPVEN